MCFWWVGDLTGEEGESRVVSGGESEGKGGG